MLTIDGTTGGGQLLRTALSLATVTDTPFRLDDVRGGRPEPGLRPQHLAAVELVADLCDADVEGAELGSDSVTFRPGDRRRGSLRADIPTAGSVVLLFDTVLPIAATAGDPVELTATGGTDVKWAPTVEYYRRVKLPLLADFGVDASVDVERTGFYPAGGGEATLRTAPSSPSSLALESRGRLERVDVYSRASEALAEREVADRQADHAAERLEEAGLPVDSRSVEYVPTRSPGSALLVRGTYEGSLAGFDAVGERRRTSEDVADDAVAGFTAFHDGAGAVDPYMADQLIVFLALAGGRVRIPSATDHVRTSLELVGRFGCDVRLERGPDGALFLDGSRHPALEDG